MSFSRVQKWWRTQFFGYQEKILPKPHKPAKARVLEEPPNFVNDVYLEMSRVKSYYIFAPAVAAVAFFILLLLFVLVNAPLFSLQRAGADYFKVFVGIVVLLCGFMQASRLTLFPPRDTPIRFNRLRRKVYVYEWTCGLWPVPSTLQCQAFDWEDLRGMAWSMSTKRVPMEGVDLLVIKPGSREILHRFVLKRYGVNQARAWDYVCAYMQNGQYALPIDAAERDANQPSNWLLKLRPPVIWPAKLDQKSTSMPSSGLRKGTLPGLSGRPLDTSIQVLDTPQKVFSTADVQRMNKSSIMLRAIYYGVAFLILAGVAV